MNTVLPPKIAFIYNSAAGAGKASLYLNDFERLINKRWEFKPFSTKKDMVPEQVRNLCEKGYNRIIVSGGDGTVRDAIHGIMVSARYPVVGVIPCGTGNDLARALGYYKRFSNNPLMYLNDLITGIEQPQYRFCRILSLNGKVYFANYLGIGYDAKIVRDFHVKKSFLLHRRLIFLLCAVSNLPFKIKEPVRISFRDSQLRLHEKTIENFKNILLINIPSYGGGFVKIEDIDLKGNNFHLILINGILEILCFLLGNKLSKILLPGIRRNVFETDDLRISLPHNKVFIQIDGEDFTECLGNQKKLVIKTAGRIRFFL